MGWSWKWWLCLGVIGASVFIALEAALELLWWRPKRLEKHFARQGIRGPPYRFFIGSVTEMVGMMLEASSEPMTPQTSHNILPRVLPFYHYWKKIYGTSSSILMTLIGCFLLFFSLFSFILFFFSGCSSCHHLSRTLSRFCCLSWLLCSTLESTTLFSFLIFHLRTFYLSDCRFWFRSLFLYCIELAFPGSTFLLWFGPTARLTVADPDLIREIFLSRSDVFERYESHPLVRQLEGEGLLSLRGERWAHHRKVLAPTFHMENLKVSTSVICC
ncbi:hypothetical protein B296_00040132 [Ensete ventricosum]|uniref:Cytochrome P450 n=1 Tax=Ensete ventricosum TaxID=4639 RepID=A0A426YCJ4_ENSVE|nr:hypothetical protein B296_00040132 [Ensete ventricosum]